MRKPAEFFVKAMASGLGLGYLPGAPGTFGTLLGIPLFWWLEPYGPIRYMLATLLLIGFGIVVSELAGRLYGVDDCQNIVIDEVAGFLVTVVWLPRTWQTVVLGFILFRILDASKPGPIGYVDRKIKGGLGVMTDDILAGIIGSLILQLIYAHTSWLGARPL